jgi:hypothetical protein
MVALLSVFQCSESDGMLKRARQKVTELPSVARLSESNKHGSESRATMFDTATHT